MTFIDTNIVLRWLLEDHPELSRQAKGIIDRAELNDEELYITDVVLSEIFYVLRGQGYNNSQVAEYLWGLVEQPTFIYDQEARLKLLFEIIGGTKLDFADCYLISRAIYSRRPLKTFDRAMNRVYDKYKD